MCDQETTLSNVGHVFFLPLWFQSVFDPQTSLVSLKLRATCRSQHNDFNSVPTCGTMFLNDSFWAFFVAWIGSEPLLL